MRFVDANFLPQECPSNWMTFDDVLLVPQTSDIESRNSKEIDLSTNLVNNVQITNPIISANMDTVTGADMAIAMHQKGCYGILHRFYDTEDAFFYDLNKVSEKVSIPGISLGINTNELNLVEKALKDHKSLVVCVDVAHGQMKKVYKQVQLLSKHFGENIYIIAGNVATPLGVSELVQAGVGAVKVGVGPGCFVAGSLVQTRDNGLVPIENIKEDEYVLTHTGKFQKVIGTLVRHEDELITQINNIKCTNNHEFYVLNKKYENIVNENNIHNYAEWIQAGQLTEDYLLIEIEP